MITINGKLSITGPLTVLNVAPTPLNYSSGNFVITAGTYSCGNVTQNIVLDDSLMSLGLGPGRWILIKANKITGWAGANVTVPSGLTCDSSRIEAIDFDGLLRDCVVVSLS